jgi:hypothetical protein
MVTPDGQAKTEKNFKSSLNQLNNQHGLVFDSLFLFRNVPNQPNSTSSIAHQNRLILIMNLKVYFIFESHTSSKYDPDRRRHKLFSCWTDNINWFVSGAILLCNEKKVQR